MDKDKPFLKYGFDIDILPDDDYILISIDGSSHFLTLHHRDGQDICATSQLVDGHYLSLVIDKPTKVDRRNVTELLYQMEIQNPDIITRLMAIPPQTRELRNAAIYKDYLNHISYDDLVKKYKLCRGRIGTIIAQARSH